MNKLILFVGTAVGMSVSHWSLVQIYTSVCQPSGIWGLAYSTLTLDSAICKTIWSAADVLKTNYSSFLGGLTIGNIIPN